MSVALDASILVYAGNDDALEQRRAADVIESVSTGSELVYVFWPVAIAYLRIATDARIFSHPLSPAGAMANLETLLQLPNVRSPGEGAGFWQIYRNVASEAEPRGPLVPDAHIVALMRQYGVRTILTRDRGFRRFDGIRVRDPFAES
jgi:toxin-antitoxin system PIN domain toxin